MVSLNNTVKIHNVIQNKFMYILLQMPAKGAKGLVIAAVTSYILWVKPLQHLIRSICLFLPEELLRFPRSVISLRHRCSSLASWKINSHSGCKLDNTCRERKWNEWVMHKNAGLPYNTTLKDSYSDTRALKQNYNQLRTQSWPTFQMQREHVLMCKVK